MTAPSSPSLSTPPSAPLTAVADSEAVASAALEVVRECALEAVNRQGVFRMALSGGRTPQALYTLLADETQLPWDHTDICFGDERLVPPDHPESNYGNARVLLDRPFVDPQRIYRMRGEISGPLAALEYERTLRGIFLDRPWPVFDLILLGLGADGHTASLFPHSAAVLETKLWVVSHYVDKLHAERLTLTLPVLNHARTMVVLVAGEDKSEALQQMLEVSGPDVTKASALARLATTLGTGPEGTVAFGDMPNDLPMLAWAGHAVAVANAHAEVRAMADEVTASNDDDGVAVVVERLLAEAV